MKRAVCLGRAGNNRSNSLPARSILTMMPWTWIGTGSCGCRNGDNGLLIARPVPCVMKVHIDGFDGDVLVENPALHFHERIAVIFIIRTNLFE